MTNIAVDFAGSLTDIFLEASFEPRVLWIKKKK